MFESKLSKRVNCLRNRERTINEVLEKTQALLKDLTKLEKTSKKALMKAQTKYSSDLEALNQNTQPNENFNRQLTQKTERFHRKVQDICDSQMTSGAGFEDVIEQLKRELK